MSYPQEMNYCALCDQDARVVALPQADAYSVTCKLCGSFQVSGLLTRTELRGYDSEPQTKELFNFLRCHIRQANERGEEVRLSSENWKELALAHKQTPFSVKVKKLLELAAARATHGHPVKFDPDSDPPLIDATDASDFAFLFRHLQEVGYATASHDWTLTLQGKAWEELEPAKTPGRLPEQRPSGHYVDPTRIEELKSLKLTSFDFSKLIRMCEELNICYAQGCYLAVAMLVRAVLDHVPPIFGCKNFIEVGNNYAGMKSFKESMKNLENSSRKIADSHLHGQIRRSESLPNKTQVNFANDIDVLLAEVARTLK